MIKTCVCGQELTLQLRTVIYSDAVEIVNVPVFSCEVCSRNEVAARVKPDLTELINGLGSKPDKQKVSFADHHEWVNLIYHAARGDMRDKTFDELVDERINHLLDVLLLAQSAGDELWAEEVRMRLKQITDTALAC